MNSDDIAYMLLRNIKLVSLISSFGSMAIISALMFSKDLRYSFPINVSLVSVNAILQGLLIGVLSCFVWDPQMTLIGTMHTLVAFLSITFFSLQTKYDLTLFSSTLVSALSVTTLGLILSIIFKIPSAYNFLSAISGVIFAAYLAHDTQKIVGGKNVKYPFSPKEYILAAVSLYQDVLNIFIQIMKILNANKKRNG